MARGKGGRVAMCVYKRGKVWWYRFTWIDCGIRPEECFRLRNYLRQDRQCPPPHSTPAAGAGDSYDARAQVDGPWIFPAPNKSGHIEPWSVRGQHAKARRLSKVEHFPIYTFRHTCLTRWAPFMDPWTLAYLAGHRDMSIAKRYGYPQEFSTRAAMEKARVALSGHSSGHTLIANADLQSANQPVTN
jgi:integrase